MVPMGKDCEAAARETPANSQRLNNTLLGNRLIFKEIKKKAFKIPESNKNTMYEKLQYNMIAFQRGRFLFSILSTIRNQKSQTNSLMTNLGALEKEQDKPQISQ